VHHKHSETDADPHNATRGFFFAHMGWLLVKKHPDVIEAGKVTGNPLARGYGARFEIWGNFCGLMWGLLRP